VLQEARPQEGEAVQDRTREQIDNDIKAVKAQVEADESAEIDMGNDISSFKQKLDLRIQEEFSAEFHALEDMKQKLAQFIEQNRPASRRLRDLQIERKWTRMVPGQRVTWNEPNGWLGTRSVGAVVLKSSGKRVQIDLGGNRYDRVKWVSIESLRVE
jgi:hypothetical protein